MEIIFLGAVAGFVIYRLYLVLGQDVGIKLAPEPVQNSTDKAVFEEAASFSDAKTIGGKIKQYMLTDPSFDKNVFLDGAGYAYGMAIKAFNEGDKDTLKALFSPKAYKVYEKEMESFKKAGEKRDDQLLQIRIAKLIDLKPKGAKKVEAVVEFSTEQVLITRDLKGNIIAGDENQIEILSDSWTFEREIASNDPNWTITETESND